jgi:hypothetical protein
MAFASAIAAAGCGHSTSVTTPASQLERSDLIAASRALSSVTGPVEREIAASKPAWPPVANGLPASITAASRAAVAAASVRAGAVPMPASFTAAPTASLTGPGAGIAGLFRVYSGLASRGWRMIGAAIDQVEHGSPAAARFARANVALYIESVYDAHFSLAQIGKQLTRGYTKLGGPSAFGASLTQAEIDSLARFYSEANARLHPHPGVRLGS